MKQKTNRYGMVLITAVSLMLTGCDRSTDPDNGHVDEMEVVHIIDRTQTAQPVIATWTHDDGWDLDVLYTLSLSDDTRPYLSLGVEVYDSHGDQLELCESCEYEIRYWLARDAATGIIDLSDEESLFHGDHVHIYGLQPGETEIEFILWHNNHADAATTPILFRVVE
jgi:hypothetical protein